MAIYQMSGAAQGAGETVSTAPLVVLFERDDAIAVPLLSQLRLAGYDVRASRTPVELFDITGKHVVALVLVDLGCATAGRREFWVALDAQRRGRSMQVMTFRYTQPGSIFDTDFEPSARAVAEVEVNGAHELSKVIDGVRQRVSPHGGAPGAFGMPSPFMQPSQAPGAYSPPAYGVSGIGMFASPLGFKPLAPTSPAPFGVPASPYAPSPFAAQAPLGFMMPGMQQPGFELPSAMPEPYTPMLGGPPSMPFQSTPFGGPASPFAQASDVNPFAADVAMAPSPFARPYKENPFAADLATHTAIPTAPPTQPALGATSPFAPPSQSTPAPMPGLPPMPGAIGSSDLPFAESRLAHLSDAYAAQFNIADLPPPRQEYARYTPPAPVDWSVSPPGDPYAASWSGASSGSSAPAPFNDAWTPPEAPPSADLGIDIGLPRAPIHLAADEPEAFQQTARVEILTAGSGGEGTMPHESPRAPAQPDVTPRVPFTSGSPTDYALGSVLVDGALLSSEKLEALRGIQQMLSSVDMTFKLGELALLFKFLSQDQLLAALLVSRGLVSPEQIAGLGRVKQDMAASGMDHDLETLLDMFHILPAEQLRQIRAELRRGVLAPTESATS